MTTDPRSALDRLVAALEAHLLAVTHRQGEADPAVVAAYQTLADAFERYDEALYAAYDEVTPFVLYSEEEDDEDEDDEDLDETDLDDEGLDPELDDLEDDDEDEDDEEDDEDLDEFEDSPAPPASGGVPRPTLLQP